jgi:hypothetical protein
VRLRVLKFAQQSPNAKHMEPQQLDLAQTRLVDPRGTRHSPVTQWWTNTNKYLIQLEPNNEKAHISLSQQMPNIQGNSSKAKGEGVHVSLPFVKPNRSQLKCEAHENRKVKISSTLKEEENLYECYIYICCQTHIDYAHKSWHNDRSQGKLIDEVGATRYSANPQLKFD